MSKAMPTLKKKNIARPVRSLNKLIYECPCCKSENNRDINLTTEWGLEIFLECLDCTIIFRGK